MFLLMSKVSSQRKERIVLLMLLGMLVVLVLFFGSLILRTHREYNNFKAREDRIEQKLIQARKEFDQKEAYLTRLLEDPEFLERIARERLGYARPDELLFRFSDEP
jgi:cell division protein FtsB